MLTASKKLWERFVDTSRRRAFARTHVGDFLAMQIFKMRSDRKLTQAELAEQIGSSQPQVSEWEGSCEAVSLRTLHKLADAFDVALSVKFIPYSEMVRESLTATADRSVPAFDQESPDAVVYPKAMVTEWDEKLRPRPHRNGGSPNRPYFYQKPGLAGTLPGTGVVVSQ